MALAGFAALSAQAQEQEGGDTTKVKEKTETITFPTQGGKVEITFHSDTTMPKKPVKPHEPEERDFWAGLDLGFGGFLTGSTLNTPTGTDKYTTILGKSGHFGLNLWELGLPLGTNHVVLLTGLGVDFDQYRFSANYNPMMPTDTSGPVVRDYITNRFVTTTFNLPLMIGFDLGKKEGKGLNFSVGVVGSLVATAQTKEKYTENNTKVKAKTTADFGINPVRVNARAKLGYGSVGIFANYSLTPMFKSGSGQPELHPFSFGLSFG